MVQPLFCDAEKSIICLCNVYKQSEYFYTIAHSIPLIHPEKLHYISTRAQAPVLNFEQAVTCGLASDGGLYVPQTWPELTHGEIRSLRELSYQDLATQLLSRFTGDDVPLDELHQIISSAYSDFDDPKIAPLREIRSGLHMLELFHGPTFSFKDYALQFLGRFMDWSLGRRGECLTVVGATSGDTGSAAISAVSGMSAIELYMLHPYQRVSDMQRRQMTTNRDQNIHNFAVDGTFDDCQAIVKAIFNDAKMRKQLSLGAVNSINWGRIAAQVVYYFYAALQLGAPDQEVSFSVPTGNFGNVFAGYTARKMGLPIKRILICSNENDILTRFFESGSMFKQGVKPTLTPSMDIEVSSNFERFLFDLLDRDGAAVSDLMNRLARTGEFSVDGKTLERARSHFLVRRVSDRETVEAISRQYTEYGLIVDPHTAVALASSDMFSSGDKPEPMVVVSTAHPAKFSDTIEKSIGREFVLPTQLSALLELPEQFGRISSDANELKRMMVSG